MQIWKHIVRQPFVAATGAAALLHSTWSLGTLFAGEQPGGWQVVGWLVPALLIAFALDVGQIVTSAEIRGQGLTWTRGITFVVFAGATYYLQWLYIAHHMPALEIAAGVSQIARQTAISMRDAALWIIPALLPLSTLLYTFSGGKPRNEKPAASHELLAEQESEALPVLPAGDGEIVEQDGLYVARCGAWEKAYKTLASAQRGLAGYKGQINRVHQQLLSSNGHSQEGMHV